MKKLIYAVILFSGVLILNFSCKNAKPKEVPKETPKEVPAPTSSEAGLILVAKDIITEVIVKPDTLGDPWEIEKVKNYNGNMMFNKLFENLSGNQVTVYNNLTETPLTPDEIKKLKKELGSDLSRIAKLQFQEDWYFNPVTNKFIKKLKSVSFGYKSSKTEGDPVRYKALFKLRVDE
jgi:hypothetical protein